MEACIILIARDDQEVVLPNRGIIGAGSIQRGLQWMLIFLRLVVNKKILILQREVTRTVGLMLPTINKARVKQPGTSGSDTYNDTTNLFSFRNMITYTNSVKNSKFK